MNCIVNRVYGLEHVHSGLMMVFVAYIVNRVCCLGHVHSGPMLLFRLSI